MVKCSDKFETSAATRGKVYPLPFLSIPSPLFLLPLPFSPPFPSALSTMPLLTGICYEVAS